MKLNLRNACWGLATAVAFAILATPAYAGAYQSEQGLEHGRGHNKDKNKDKGKAQDAKPE